MIFGEHTITYDQFHRQVVAAAARLAEQGIEAGDRVAWLGENHPSFLIDFLACARLDAIFVPLNTRLTVAEHRYQLADCTPSLVLARANFVEHLDEVGAPSPVLPVDEALAGASLAPEARERHEALAGASLAPEARERDEALAGDHAREGSREDVLLVYTSGTTGAPKGAVHTKRALAATIENGIAAQDLTAEDTALAFLPLFHVGGLNIQVLPQLAVGGTVVLLDRFDPGLVLAQISRHRPTVGLFVPATMRAVLDHPAWADTDLSCFRGVMTGSSVVPESLLRSFLDAGVRPGQVYGSTETGPTSLVLRFDEAEHVGSCGRPALTAEVVLGPDHEILVAGPHLFSRYWDNEAATAEAFSGRWYHTGDIGTCDDDGLHTIADRLDDLIISGGENVHPVEVEDVLSAAPGVAEISIIGRADSRWGAVPVAFVVAEPDQETPDIESLRQWAAGRLARFKLPQAVVVVDALPRTALGKVKKHELRKLLEE